MGRRCLNWDYSSRAIYEITITLKDRSNPFLSSRPVKHLVSEVSQDGEASNSYRWEVIPTEMGKKVLRCWQEIPNRYPQISLIASQIMPEHFHGVLFVKESLKPKQLGDVIRGFKTGSREVGWDSGFVDSILWRKGQLKKMVDYLRDNPRRLGLKRENPDLFKVADTLPITLLGKEIDFSTVGNRFLLNKPVILQVQCSRKEFAYKRERLPSGKSRVVRDKEDNPIIEFSTEEFKEKAARLLSAADHGAVIISPCISDGEKEIARLAMKEGASIITLRNKAFPRLFKPEGRYFDACAEGKLLMLAPAAWKYIPGEKKISREDALILNRIAQLIAEDGAAEINYKGYELNDVDSLVKRLGGYPA
ncbi:MAG: hypothetical protein MJ109_02050 [Kiritimatiellae bacterium]|nr:hypothetical protein [Kiritimatiellia bacterium]